ncbi:MAG: hypothetical protein WAN50_03890 [Minisyncoccia bacterium]
MSSGNEINLWHVFFGFGSGGFSASLNNIWTLIVLVGYTVSVAGFATIIYCSVRLFELRHNEEEYYRTLITTPEEEEASVSRWKHITALAAGTSPSEWREAIIEADIMLEDELVRYGCTGIGVGEKLKSPRAAGLATLQDAWEAHKVRNQIAHEGSAFNLSDTIAQRTIQRYENVFRELKAI